MSKEFNRRLEENSQIPEPRVLLAGLQISLSSGGVTKTIGKFKEALQAEVVSFTNHYSQVPEEEPFEGIEHVYISHLPFVNWYGWASPAARKRAEEMAGGANLISCHVMLRYHALWVWRMAQDHRIPYWFVPHGQLDPFVFSYRRLTKLFWIWLYGKRFIQNASHVIFSTQAELNKAKWIYDGENTRVIHWPVELVDISRRDLCRINLRKQLGIPGDSRVLVFLGRLHSMKRPLETIELFCRATSGSDHLIIMGMENDVTVEQCQGRAARFGMSNQVHVLGPKFGEEKENILLGADGYISLSNRENFGHTAAESLACGLPVILSPGNDLSNELKPYSCGFFLNSFEEDEAIRSIREFCSLGSDALRKMGARGREFIAKECSFEVFQDSLLELLREAILENSKKKHSGSQ